MLEITHQKSLPVLPARAQLCCPSHFLRLRGATGTTGDTQLYVSLFLYVSTDAHTHLKK